MGTNECICVPGILSNFAKHCLAREATDPRVLIARRGSEFAARRPTGFNMKMGCLTFSNPPFEANPNQKRGRVRAAYKKMGRNNVTSSKSIYCLIVSDRSLFIKQDKHLTEASC